MHSNQKQNIPDWQNKVILIVEDNELNYRLLEKMLEKTKVKIIHARDGQDAIDISRKESSIDLVLMDIQMPGIDGFEATEKIKSFLPDVPVIAQTAYSSGLEQKRIKAAGCSDYLTKPINQQHLLDIIDSYL